MELYVVNNEFQTIDILDDFKSLIWTKRYSEFGDCELYISANLKNFTMIRIGYYLVKSDDPDMICRVESIELNTDSENGDYLTVIGLDCRHILNQRIIAKQTNHSGTVEEFIERLIAENITYASNPYRRIPNFRVGESLGLQDQIIQQVTYDNLGEKIIELCKTFGYGSKVKLDGIMFTFELYVGKDRSYNQSVNNQVVFSPDYDNLKTSKFLNDAMNYKNSALVGGEGEGVDRQIVEYNLLDGEGIPPIGLERREIFVDAKGVSSNTDDEEISYEDQLITEGQEVLSENKVLKAFEGEVIADYTYIYGEDYFLGDIVQVINEYGLKSSARIVEVIESIDDEGGHSVIPTFEYMEVQQ